MSSILETERRKYESQSGDRRTRHEKASLATAKTAMETKAETETETGRRPLSPYTVHTLDAAIAHLEMAMSADKAMAIFGVRYWHQRVLELCSTRGILHDQERRLRCLLDRFAATG